MANALTGYYGGSIAGQNALANAGRQLDPMTGLYFDPSDPSGALYDSSGKQVWDTTSSGPNLSGPWGDPQLNPATQGATGQYGTTQNPYLPNTINIGGEPVVSGDYSQAEGVASYNRNQQNLATNPLALGNPASVAAIVMGGAAAGGAFGGASGGSGGATGYGSGVSSASDAAYGSVAGGEVAAPISAFPGGAPSTLGGLGGGGASGFGAAAEGAVGPVSAGGAAGWGPVFGTVGAGPPAANSGLLGSLVPGAGGGSMKIGDWLNLGNTALGAISANKAANVQQGASADAIAELRRQYDTTRADQAPYQAAGVKALGNLSDPNANFMASPDYAFRRSEGQRDIGNSFAARGGAFSGNALRALDQYNQSLASGEFGNWWNRQAGLAGVGQTANAQTGVLGQNTANNVANNIVGAGDARASGIQNTAAILGGGARNFVGNYLYRNAPYQPYGGYSPYQSYGG